MIRFLRAHERREGMARRVRLIVVALGIAIGVIATAYWIVQGIHGAEYRQLAENNRLRKLAIKAPRGVVFDRHGRPLAENVPAYTLLLDPERASRLESSWEHAARILDRPSRELVEQHERRSEEAAHGPVPVAQNLTLPQVARFELSSLEHPEFLVEVEQQRLYRHREQTAHVLGYLGEAGPSDIDDESGYRRGSMVGRRGTEKRYEERLRGIDGERVVVVDSRGRVAAEYRRRPAVPGEDLRLALDLELQQAAYRALQGRVGAAVALDPDNGEILALVSTPAFDPNLFVRDLAPEVWQDLVDDRHHPLQNRALQNVHSPGSVFKIAMALAALAENAVSPQDRLHCAGSDVFYGHRFRCWRRGGHGWVDLHEAIKESCDVYFYELGQRLGIDRIARHSRRLGLGTATGVDLDGEKSGLVPSPEWSRRVRGHPWYPGETISVAIGQGPLLVTPVQIAALTATVATRGLRPVPTLHLSRSTTASRVDLSPRIWDPVREALAAVVADGTGANARIDDFPIAGKTGTVQVVRQSTWTKNDELPYEQRDHAWFTSYGPVDDPELVVTVFVEHGGTGSKAAAPVAKQIYEAFLRQRPDLRRPQAS